MDLVEFLRARLDEDEAAAKDERVWFNPHPEDISEREGWLVVWPERVLREVAAKHAILDEHEPEPWGEPHPELLRCAQGHGDEYWTSWPCVEVRALAAVYSGHPDYRAGWAPVTLSTTPGS